MSKVPQSALWLGSALILSLLTKPPEAFHVWPSTPHNCRPWHATRGAALVTKATSTDPSSGADPRARSLLLQDELEEKRMAVLNHPLCELIGTEQCDDWISLVKVFMEHHVWVVWDYFSLFKRLQVDLSVVQMAWYSTTDRPHLDLYIRAMEQAGANVEPMQKFLEYLENNNPTDIEEIMNQAKSCGAPPTAVEHIRHTTTVAMQSGTAEVVALFCYGREDMIPGLLSNSLRKVPDENTSILKHYLETHMEMNRDDHGIYMVEGLCQGDEGKWQDATKAAKRALDNRSSLWEAVRQSYLTPR